MRLRWDKWIYGLASGFIGGGASAVVCSGMAAILAPDKFSPATDFKNFMILASTTFLANGLMSAFFFLRQSPLPPREDTTVVRPYRKPDETKTTTQ